MKIRNFLFLHCIIMTDAHKEIITPEVEVSLYKYIKQIARKHKCKILEIGGTENHVHFILHPNPDLSLDETLKRLKHYTQFKISKTVPDFYWAEGYYVYSISMEDIENESIAILEEKNKHKTLSLDEELKKLREDLEMNATDSVLSVNETRLN